MTTITTPAAALQAIADAAVVERRSRLEPATTPKISGDPQHDGAHLLEFVNGLDAVHTERALRRAGWSVEPGPRRWGVVVLRARAPKEAT